jgi:hypothetical protein
MSHFLMSTSAAPGHVHPNLPVMAELVARGLSPARPAFHC